LVATVDLGVLMGKELSSDELYWKLDDKTIDNSCPSYNSSKILFGNGKLDSLKNTFKRKSGFQGQV
jgi:hypothetical protein